MKIPTEYDLAGSQEPYCLDTEWMLKNFLGKDQKAAIELMKTTNVSEDFGYMQLKRTEILFRSCIEVFKK